MGVKETMLSLQEPTHTCHQKILSQLLQVWRVLTASTAPMNYWTHMQCSSSHGHEVGESLSTNAMKIVNLTEDGIEGHSTSIFG